MRLSRGQTSEQSDAEYARADAKRLAAMPERLRRVCWCQVCGLVFTGVGGFDAHRTGPISDRRCLTPAEMVAKGYAVGDLGRWGSPA